MGHALTGINCSEKSRISLTALAPLSLAILRRGSIAYHRNGG